jgi:STE24 endopeptidase
MCRYCLYALFLLVLTATPLPAQPEAQAPIAQRSQPKHQLFDAESATNAYLASVPAAQRQRTDAYIDGGYWIRFWGFLSSAVLMLFLLYTRISVRMRDLAERLSRSGPIQTIIYYVEFSLLTGVVMFPFSLYVGFFRERQYGFMNQSLSGWMVDFFKMEAVNLVLGGIGVTVLFAIVRRFERSWHVWCALFSILSIAFLMVVSPVYISPLVNHYQRLENPRVREAVLNLARANGVPAAEIYEYDASRQSKRISAHVSGFLGTERIALNDNLLTRCTPAEIKAVMAHEIGHYVLNHLWKSLMLYSILYFAFFLLLRRALILCLSRWGTSWEIRSIGDPAILPLAVVIASLFLLVAEPITTTFTRIQEKEADLFGLNAAREPDAAARVFLKLGEYRKLDPGPVEEFLFFDHPGCRNRIAMAMRWKETSLHEPGESVPAGIGR